MEMGPIFVGPGFVLCSTLDCGPQELKHEEEPACTQEDVGSMKYRLFPRSKAVTLDADPLARQHKET